MCILLIVLHTRIQPIVLAMTKPPISGQGEVRRAEARGIKGQERGGVLGERAANLLPTSVRLVCGAAMYRGATVSRITFT